MYLLDLFFRLFFGPKNWMNECKEKIAPEIFWPLPGKPDFGRHQSKCQLSNRYISIHRACRLPSWNFLYISEMKICYNLVCCGCNLQVGNLDDLFFSNHSDFKHFSSFSFFDKRRMYSVLHNTRFVQATGLCRSVTRGPQIFVNLVRTHFLARSVLFQFLSSIYIPARLQSLYWRARPEFQLRL